MSRVFVVTGGASGIGLGVSQLFARDGHKVALLDRQGDLAKAESDALNAEGFKTLSAVVDVTDRAQMAAAFDKVRSEFGPIEGLITSAGIAPRVPFLEMKVEEWQQVLDINLTGTFHAIQLALPDMLERKWGRIVTMSSVSTQLGVERMAHYAASKGGTVGLTKAIAIEFAAHGITANAVVPSIVVTPMALKSEAAGRISFEALKERVPARRLSTPDEIAGACAYLCSDIAGYVTGQQLSVNGGLYL